MQYTDIRYEVDGPVLTVTLNRPDKLNAYTAVMGRELEDAFRRADADDAIRAIIVTGEGRGFCAGADISAGANSFDAAGGNSVAFGTPSDTGRRTRGGGFVEAIFNCRKPSIAAINGPAVGVGLTLTLPMDIRVAAEEARFGFVFARRGLVPEAGSAWFLPQLVGLSQALRWCLSGRVFGSAEALAGQLVSEVVPGKDLLARAKAIAQEIAEETAPVSVALTRQLLWRFASAPDYSELLRLDGPLAMDLGAGGDVREGVAAFLEKRKPRFPGRVSTDMPKRYPWWEADGNDA
jgi:enoyl-CoA hydratase/carnithine racemase